MKKGIVFIIVTFLLLSSCELGKDEEDRKPDLSNLHLSNYSGIVITEASTSKGITSNIGYDLYGIDKIDSHISSITYDSGSNFFLESIIQIDANHLLFSFRQEMILNYQYYIINTQNDQVIYLNNAFAENGLTLEESAYCNFEYYYNTDIGFITILGIKTTNSKGETITGNAIVKFNFETNEISFLTSPEFDGYLSDFYASKSGNIVAGGFDRNDYPAIYLAANGNSLITASSSLVQSLVRYKDTSCIGSSTSDFIIDLENKRLIRFTESGLDFESFTYNDGTLLGRAIFKEKTNASSNTIPFHFLNAGILYTYIGSSNELIVTANENNNYSITRYSLPAQFPTGDGYIAILNQYIVKEQNAKNGLFFYNYVTGDMGTIDYSLVDWSLTKNGIIYSKYVTATHIQTFLYNFSSKETTLMKDSIMNITETIEWE